MKRLQHTRFSIDTSSPFAWAAMALMGSSAIVRLIYYVVKPLQAGQMLLHLWLPLLATALFLIVVPLFGRKYPQATALSVLLGVIFFIAKAADFAPVHRALCTILYIAVLALYSLTVFGIIPVPYLLYPLFGLPLLYHIFVEDMSLYILADPPVPVFDWFPEISVLCIMAALLCISLALRKQQSTSC